MPAACGALLQQRGQGGRLVAKQRGQRLALPAYAVGGQSGGAVKARLPRGPIAFAQQPARSWREARVEKPLAAPR